MISGMVNKITAFILVFILFAHNISTLTIIGNFIINQDFIAKTLCIQKENQQGCQGKCQLMSALNNKNIDSKTTIPVKETKRFSLDAFCSYDIKNLENINTFNREYRFKFKSHTPQLLTLHFEIETPPPITA